MDGLRITTLKHNKVKKTKIKLGIIGVGKWGMNFVKTISEIDNIILTAISTRNLLIKRKFEENYVIYSNWKELVNSEQIDGVIITTPPNSHFEILNYCIEKKLPALVEKPLTIQLSEAKDLLAYCQNNPSLVLVDHIYLYEKNFREIKKISKNNNRIISINTMSGSSGPFRNDVRALWDWGSHDIAMCIDLMNSIPKVLSARYAKKNSKGEIVEAKLLFQDNCEANILIGNLFEKKIRNFKVELEDLKITYEPFKKNLAKEYIDKKLNHDKGKTFNIYRNYELPMKTILREFAYLISRKEKVYSDLELGFKTIQTLENIKKKLA